uniref:Pre-C2HC domain-containing protein n=1 Tax=Phlebotomus papatasi TaxID=29031 RepID=A0A1B0DIS4_PHLPP
MGTESGGAMDSVADSNNANKRVRLYPPNFRGPYTVYIRALEGKSINRLTIWNMLVKKFKTTVEVKKMFTDKVRVVFSDIKEANSCVQDKDFSAFRVYIQANIVEIDGVVIMDLDENEKMLEKGVGKLEKCLETDIKILEVFRMKRKSIRESVVSTLMESGSQTHVESKIEWVPAKAVRVTFQGSILPDYIKVFGVVVQVLAFNPKVMFCEKCLRYGHTKAFCNNKRRCLKCGLIHDLSAVCDVPQFSCPNCKKNFPSKNHKCEARQFLVDSLIRKAQARHNLSYAGIVRGDKGVKRQREEDNQFEVLSGHILFIIAFI